MTSHAITSPANHVIKHLKKLQRDKSARDEAGEFVIENLLIITDALNAGRLPTAVFVTPAVQKKTLCGPAATAQKRQGCFCHY